jgi:hypothetical protein
MKFFQEKVFLRHFRHIEKSGWEWSPISHEITTVTFDICNVLSYMHTAGNNYNNDSTNSNNTKNTMSYSINSYSFVKTTVKF